MRSPSEVNDNIKLLARGKGVCQWEIADYLGIHEMTLTRWMRRELPEEKRLSIVNAINAIAESREARDEA